MRQMPTVLFDADRIRERIQEIGREVGESFAGQELCVVGLMKSCLVFMADLIRAIPLELSCHTVRVVQSGEAAASSRVEIVYATEVPYRGRNVLLLDDVVGTGIPLSFLIEHIREHEPKTLKVCALIDRTQERKIELTPDWAMFSLDESLDDRFLVGYGLENEERYMGLPYIGTIPREGAGEES